MMKLDGSLASLFLEQKKRIQAKKDEKNRISKEKVLVRDFKIKVCVSHGLCLIYKYILDYFYLFLSINLEELFCFLVEVLLCCNVNIHLFISDHTYKHTHTYIYLVIIKYLFFLCWFFKSLPFIYFQIK